VEIENIKSAKAEIYGIEDFNPHKYGEMFSISMNYLLLNK
jgi:hypothetical protein